MTAPVPPIHEVKGRNRFCGPAAYAALTGRSTDQASRAIREITGKPNVMGLHRSHLRSALQQAGLQTTSTALPDQRTTLAALIPSLAPGRYLICIGGRTNGHYVVLRTDNRRRSTIADSHHRVPVPAKDFGWKSAGRRSGVRHCYGVSGQSKA